MPAVTAQEGALTGIRVIDFTQVIFGPSCTAQLADHGAEVIKIERPNSGDLSRQFGPYLDGESLPYGSFNRNKKSITIDLKNPQGRDLVFRMLETADVVVNNFRPGVMDSLGLSYEEIRNKNERIIYACGTGFGSTGPLAESRKMGHDSVAQAISGPMFGNAGPDGAPRRVPVPLGDVTAGLQLTVGILLALHARERTGVGQQVEVSLLDSLLWMQGWGVASAANLTDQPSHSSNPLDGGIYKASDGYIVLTGLFRPNPLQAISKVLDLPDLSKEDRFIDVKSMTENADELRSLLQEKISDKPADHWEEQFDAVDIICSPILSLKRAIQQPQVEHNQMVVEVSDLDGQKKNIVGVPIKLGDTPGSVRSAAPRLGQQTDEILRSAGLTLEEIDEYSRKGIV